MLADILAECHFGSTLDPENPVQVAEYNVGVMILSKMGTFAEGTLLEVVHVLAGIVPQENIEEEG